MKLIDVQFNKIPTTPGIYKFLGNNKEILYVGKATNLRQRIRSYFDDELIKTRGRFIVDMVTKSNTVDFETTKTVLDALILEASLIKKEKPHYNTREKDNRSFAYIVVTNEDYPRVLQLRERNLFLSKSENDLYLASFGPFQSAQLANKLLSIVRKIIPFRDKCIPGQNSPCFNRQIGLCSGVCDSSISKTEYNKQIRDFIQFMNGGKDKLISKYSKRMLELAKNLNFEEANKYKKIIFALNHINDVSLINDEVKYASQESSALRDKPFRIEAYDISHLFGTLTVGSMVVVNNGQINKREYRKFKIKGGNDKPNDLQSLKEVLNRRFKHLEWQKPDVVVIDGGLTHLRFAQKLLKELNIDAIVCSVVKDNRHKQKSILGNKDITESYKNSILLSNLEAHRFAVEYHRKLREKIV